MPSSNPGRFGLDWSVLGFYSQQMVLMFHRWQLGDVAHPWTCQAAGSCVLLSALPGGAGECRPDERSQPVQRESHHSSYFSVVCPKRTCLPRGRLEFFCVSSVSNHIRFKRLWLFFGRWVLIIYKPVSSTGLNFIFVYFLGCNTSFRQQGTRWLYTFLYWKLNDFSE